MSRRREEDVEHKLDALSQAATWQAYAEELEGALREIASTHEGHDGWTSGDYSEELHACQAVAECALSSPRPSPSNLLEVARAAVEASEGLAEPDGGVFRAKGKTLKALDALCDAVDALSPAERKAIMGGEGE